MRHVWLVLLLGLMMAVPVPARHLFDGFGEQTHGHEGATVVTVTNLADSGAGSLRAAIGSDRRIRFTVSGALTLNSDIDITGVQNLTIDGFDAPGLVSLRRYGLDIRLSSNIIVRNLEVTDARICNGASTCVTQGSNGACCETANPATCVNVPSSAIAGCTELGHCVYAKESNVGLVFDHVTLISAADTQFGVGDGSNSITLQNSLILSDNNWGQGSVFIGGAAPDGTRARALTVARSLLADLNPATGGCRKPRAQQTTGTVTTVDFRNNLVWDWRNTTACAGDYTGSARTNTVANYYHDPNATNQSHQNDAIRHDGTGMHHTSGNYHQFNAAATTHINGVGNAGTVLVAPEFPTQHACVIGPWIKANAGTKPRSARAQTIVNAIQLTCPQQRRLVYH